jgi:putative colanic acid biosynthesis glycosyltransferase
MPLITIVTIVKDNREGLAHTLASVVEQEAQNWELLIVLAHSIDGSYEFAQKVAKDNPKIKIIMQSKSMIYA